MFSPYSAVIDFTRQILTSKVNLRTVRVTIFIMAVYPKHRYSSESERAEILNFKLKKL